MSSRMLKRIKKEHHEIGHLQKIEQKMNLFFFVFIIQSQFMVFGKSTHLEYQSVHGI